MNKILKTLLYFSFMAAVLYIAKDLNIAEAIYGIPDEYKPDNEPFDIDITDPETGGARGATVLILQILAGGLLYFAAPVAVIAVIISAFIYVVGGAESEKVDQAKKALTWSIVGLVCVVMSYSAVRAIITVIVRAAEAT